MSDELFAQKWFEDAISKMRICQAIELMSCGQSQPLLYVYDHVSNTTRRPFPNEVMWPIEYLLAHHHKKHIFTPKSQPDLAVVGKSLASWANKVRWRHVYFHDPGATADDEELWKLKSRRTFTHPCPHSVSPEMEAFILDTTSSVFEACRRSRSRALGRAKEFASSIDAVSRIAMHILRMSNWGAICTDKDGGFTLIDKDQLVEEKLQILRRANYEPLSIRDENFNAELLDRYKQAALAYRDDLESESLCRTLSSDLGDYADNIVSQLHLNCKTHKTPPEFRAIHASVNHPLKPGMRMVARDLSHSMKPLGHILRDSDHLIEIVSKHTFAQDCCFAKLDVGDFFMSGEHSLLAEKCAKIKNAEGAASRRCFKELLSAILGSQVLAASGAPGSYWRVKIGSGMGLLCSGEVSDYVFYELSERYFATNKRLQRREQVVLYLRFKDDILVIMNGGVVAVRRFVARLQRVSRCFVVKLEDVQTESVNMLDLCLYKGKDFAMSGRLSYKLYIKPTNIWLPLSPLSGQAPNVHSSWPRSQESRLRKRFSDRFEGERAVNDFKSRMIASFGLECPDSGTTFPTHHSARPQVSTRIILPYLPHWSLSRLPSVLSGVYERHNFWVGVDSKDANWSSVQVAWSLGAPHLVNVVRRLNLNMSLQADQYKVFNRNFKRYRLENEGRKEG